MDKEQILEQLQKKISKGNILVDEPMKKHTSFKIGGPADFYITIQEIEELRFLLEYTKEKEIPLFIVGNGSNLLVLDGGIRGIVAKIDKKQISLEKKQEEVYVTVGAGVTLGFLAQKMLKESVAGLEFASGIPGTIGGAIYMNAGAHGKEMKDIVVSTTYLDEQGKIKTVSKEEQEFSYRHSKFEKEKSIILETTLKLELGNSEQIKEKMEEHKKYRMEKQPIDYPSAGSTFKIGKDYITAKLIDEAGLKGYRIGGAEVSSKHAGFIINREEAKAEDIITLVSYVKQQIKEKFGKDLELEIKVIGEKESKK